MQSLLDYKATYSSQGAEQTHSVLNARRTHWVGFSSDSRVPGWADGPLLDSSSALHGARTQGTAKALKVPEINRSHNCLSWSAHECTRTHTHTHTHTHTVSPSQNKICASLSSFLAQVSGSPGPSQTVLRSPFSATQRPALPYLVFTEQ